MNKGKQVFTASILAAVLVVSIAVLSVPEAEGLHPIDIVGAIGPGELALNLLVPLDFNVALETDGAGEIVSSAVTDTELNLLDGRVGTLVSTGAASTYGDFDQIFRDRKLIVRDDDNSNSYIISGAASTTDRVITIPAPIGNDFFVLQDHAQAITGKTITSAGNTLTIDCDVATCSGIDDGNIDGDAAIAFSKLGTLTEGNILIGGGGGVVTSVNPTGSDVEASTGSGLIIGANKVTSAKLADAIELPTSLKVGPSGVTIKAILVGTEATPVGGRDSVAVTGAATGDVAFCAFAADTDDDTSVIVGDIKAGLVEVQLTDHGGTGMSFTALTCIVFDIT